MKSKISEYFVIENRIISDKSTIANTFNELAKEMTIRSIKKSFKNHLQSPTENKCNFVEVGEAIVYKLINHLKPKDSCGQDGLSSALLIQLKDILIKGK